MFQPIQSNSSSLNNKSILINPNSRMTWSVHISHRPTPSPTTGPATTNPTTSRMPSRTPSPDISCIWTDKNCTSLTPLLTQPFKSAYNPSLSHRFFLLGFLDTSSRMQDTAGPRTSAQILSFGCSIRHVGECRGCLGNKYSMSVNIFFFLKIVEEKCKITWRTTLNTIAIPFSDSVKFRTTLKACSCTSSSGSPVTWRSLKGHEHEYIKRW